MEKEIINNKNDLQNIIEVLSLEYASLIENNVDPKVYFKKKKYSEYFENYCKHNEELFQRIKQQWDNLETENSKRISSDSISQSEEKSDQELSDEQKMLLKGIARGLAEAASQEINGLKGMKKGNRQSELNLFLVTSVFPCTLELGEPYGEALCKALVEAWKEEFPGVELGYASYEKLSSSFRSFWGFLTGR